MKKVLMFLPYVPGLSLLLFLVYTLGTAYIINYEVKQAVIRTGMTYEDSYATLRGGDTEKHEAKRYGYRYCVAYFADKRWSEFVETYVDDAGFACSNRLLGPYTVVVRR